MTMGQVLMVALTFTVTVLVPIVLLCVVANWLWPDEDERDLNEYDDWKR